MTLSDDIYASLEASFTPGIPPSTPAATIVTIQASWRSLADAFALASAGTGGLVSAPGMADGYLTFYTGTTTAAGDNDLTYDRVTSQLKLNGSIKLRDLEEAQSTPASGYGILYIKGDAPYYMNDSGTEFALIESTDLTGLTNTVQEHYNQRLASEKNFRVAADGYGAHVARVDNPHTVTATQVGKDTAQWNASKVHSRVMDFKAPADGQAFIWDAATEKWIPNYFSVDDIPDFQIAVDGYVVDATFQQNKTYWNEAIHHLRVAADAYGQGATESEHYQQHSDAIQTILKDLDGYASDQTVTEHYQQHSQAFESILKDLDGYASEQTVTEHYNQHSDAITTILKDLDGYSTSSVAITSGADGYVAFYNGATSLAGDNDLFFNRVDNRLEISAIKLSTDPTEDYVLTSDSSGVGTWQRNASSFDRIVTTLNEAGDDIDTVYDSLTGGNVVSY